METVTGLPEVSSSYMPRSPAERAGGSVDPRVISCACAKVTVNSAKCAAACSSAGSWLTLIRTSGAK